MQVIRPYKKDGAVRRVEWVKENIREDYLSNKQERWVTAMQYTVDLDFIQRWFGDKVLPRPRKMPSEQWISGYRLRLDHRSEQAINADKCGECAKGIRPQRALGRVELSCWHVPGAQKRCACCMARGKKDCSFETRAYSRAATYTSNTQMERFREDFGIFKRSFDRHVARLRDGDVRDLKDDFQQFARSVARLGDLSYPMINEPVSHPVGDEDDNNEAVDDYEGEDAPQ